MFSAKSLQIAESGALPDGSGSVVNRQAGGEESQRFFHLDALRAALMFWGILVHASTVAESLIFRKIAELSGLVRMEAFFIISGFLAYMLLRKYGAGRTLKKRLPAVGLPLLMGVILLNPITNYLILCYYNPVIPFSDFLQGEGISTASGPISWLLHFWFLVALFAHWLLSPLIARAVDLGLRFVVPGDRVRNPETAFLALATGVSLACLGSRVVFEMVKPGLPEQVHYFVRSIGNFLPFFALGMVLFSSPNLRCIFCRLHWQQLLLSCVLLAAAHRITHGDASRLEEVAILMAQTYVAVCLSSLLFWIAGKWVRGESGVVRAMSGSAYSVYLFHFLALYLFALAFRPLISNPLALLSVISVATFLATFGLHHFVIRRVPYLELAFNGRFPRRTR